MKARLSQWLIAGTLIIIPTVINATTGFAPVDKVLNYIPLVIAGIGGVLGVGGLGMALAAWNSPEGHGGNIMGRGIKSGISGSGMVGIGAIGNQIYGNSQSLSLEDIQSLSDMSHSVIGYFL